MLRKLIREKIGILHKNEKLEIENEKIKGSRNLG